MLNEILGYVWWEYENDEEPSGENYCIFVEAGPSVYRSSSSERVWRKVDDTLNPDRMVFHSPVATKIAQCLTGKDGTLYILLTDGTAINMFPSTPPGGVTICGGAAGFLREERVLTILASNLDLIDTPIYTDTHDFSRSAQTTTGARVPERCYYPLLGVLKDNRHLSIPWSCICDDGERQDGIEEITPHHPQYATWYQALQEKEQRLTEHEEETRRARAERRAKRQTHDKS